MTSPSERAIDAYLIRENKRQKEHKDKEPEPLHALTPCGSATFAACVRYAAAEDACAAAESIARLSSLRSFTQLAM
jgi:hypothetical protein